MAEKRRRTDDELDADSTACMERNRQYLIPLAQRKARTVVIISFHDDGSYDDAITVPGEESHVALIASQFLGPATDEVIALRPSDPLFPTDILVILIDMLTRDRMHVYGAVWKHCRWKNDPNVN